MVNINEKYSWFLIIFCFLFPSQFFNPFNSCFILVFYRKIIIDTKNVVMIETNTYTTVFVAFHLYKFSFFALKIK